MRYKKTIYSALIWVGEPDKALLVGVDQCQKWSPLSSCLWLAMGHQLCTQDNHQHESRWMWTHTHTHTVNTLTINHILSLLFPTCLWTENMSRNLFFPVCTWPSGAKYKCCVEEVTHLSADPTQRLQTWTAAGQIKKKKITSGNEFLTDVVLQRKTNLWTREPKNDT